jgi:hypothetical protein
VESLPPARRRRLIAKRDRYERAVRSLLESGMADGDLTAEDPAVVTRAMLGALNWTAAWFRPGGPQDARHVGDIIARFLVRGVRGVRGVATGARPSRPRGSS